MATAWRFVAYYALPVPLVLLILMNFPGPRVIRRGVLNFVHRVFDLPLVGAFRLLHVMLFLTGMALLSALRVLHNLRSLESEAVWPTANAELTYLSKRWRAERNSWIAGFAFTMWCVLAAFYREAARRLDLEERLGAIEKAAAEQRAQRTAATRNAPVAPREGGAKEQPPEAASSLAAKPEGQGIDGEAEIVEKVVAEPPAALLEPRAEGIQLQEFKKDL